MGNNNNSSSGKGSLFLIGFIIILLLTGLGSCSGGSNKKYTCEYCGIKMETYWSYHDGYVCYWCDKKYYK